MKRESPESAPPAVPVAIGRLAPRRLRPGALLAAASARGAWEVWIHSEAIPPREARRRFEARLAAGGARLRPLPEARAVLRRALGELDAYFRGGLRRFSCPLDLRGRGTPLDEQVRDALRTIPYGEVRSYGEVARAIRRPRAARAVGRSCSRNPLPVMVPCHRVVGADGSLTGFAGGLPLKEVLLSIEGREPARPPRAAGSRPGTG